MSNVNFTMPIERKLAAIMFTDIAGYTEQMSKSESKSLDLLEKKRSILKPLIKEYNGTFVKEIGDGTLSYFESAVNAATCAVGFMEDKFKCSTEVPFRVLLVDDVLTTGATSNSCAQTLKNAGAKWVGVMTLATPRLIKGEAKG